MTGDIYHVVNRGFSKSEIFLERNDYLRFIRELHRFNNKEGALKNLPALKYFNNPLKQNKMIELLKWVLMPNHYHLLVCEIIDGGAVEFVKRLGNGYTKYFNIKYKRSGYLFQNSAKIINAVDLPHFLHLPHYIDSNPLKLIEPRWKEGIINKTETELIEFLKSYEFSSYYDYSKTSRNFSQIINREKFYELFDYKNGEEYQSNFQEWLSSQPATFNVAG